MEKARVESAKTISAKAREAYADLAPMMRDWRTEGLTLQQIGERLNNDGHTTRRGKPWNPMQVARVLEMAK